MLLRKHKLTFFTKLQSHGTYGRWTDSPEVSDEHVNNSNNVMNHPRMILILRKTRNVPILVFSVQDTGELTETFFGQNSTLCDLTRALFTFALLWATSSSFLKQTHKVSFKPRHEYLKEYNLIVEVYVNNLLYEYTCRRK